MIQENYDSTGSVINRLKPETKLIAASVLSIGASISQSFLILGCYGAVGVVLFCLSGLTMKQAVHRVKPVFLFLVMIWIILPLTFNQGPFYTIGILKFSTPGLRLCSLISVKSITILFLFTILVATMPIASIGTGLHRLKLPDKLVFLFLMTYRYIAVIRAEYTRLIRAAKFRGFIPATSFHAYKTYAYLAGMLFVRASSRANRVYQAMICRGFTGIFHTLDMHAAGRFDKRFLIIIILAGVSLSGIEIIWMVK